MLLDLLSLEQTVGPVPPPVVLFTDADGIRKIPNNRPAWVGAWISGTISNEEFIVLMNSEKGNVR